VDRSAWTDPVITRNPAWAFAHTLRRRGADTMISDDRIDLAAIKAWADACEADAPNASEKRWTYDEVVEGGSIWTVCQNIASHARARFAVIDGKYSIVRDVSQSTPVQHISPRNSSNYRGRKAFVDIPHAFRVQFPNTNTDWQTDEVIVYRDGYNADGSGGNTAASKFEALELRGCTSSTQAWREGRYHFATLLLRPEEHQVEMDVEHLRCTVGDLVRFSHDVVSIGLGAGRIAAVTTSAGNVTAYALDAPVEMTAGTTYGLRIRKADGTTVVHTLTTVAGLQDTVTLATPVAAGSGTGQVGDMFQFGVSTLESAPMLVKRIEPSTDFRATLTLVDAQSGVYSADTGTIPAFSTYITRTITADQAAPDAPTLTLRSDETAILRLADRTLIDRILVYRSPPAPSDVPFDRWEVQIRRNGTNGAWEQVGIYNTDGYIVAIDGVVDGLVYDVRARTISIKGVPSAWTTVTGHTVIGKTTTPSTLTGLNVTRYFDGNLVSWTATSDLDVIEYEVRVGGSSWDTATFLGKGITNAYFDARTSFTSLTYRVRARDAIGLLSAEATITANPSAPVLGASQVAGIQGQGALATAGFVSLGTTLIRRADGSTTLTESLVVTSLGTAAGISGQGILATRNTVGTAQIDNGAVRNSYNASLGSASQSISGTTVAQATVMSINTSTTAKPTTATGSSNVTVQSNIDVFVWMVLYENSTEIFRTLLGKTDYTGVGTLPYVWYGTAAMTYSFTPPSGSPNYTWYVELTTGGSGISALVTQDRRNGAILEIKV